MQNSQTNQIIKEVKEQYNSIAKEWDLTRQVPTVLKMKQIKRFKKGQKVLDLGCGNGLVTGEIVKLGVKYYGLDISNELVKIARKKYSQEVKSGVVQFKIGDACKKLPYKNNFFDAAISLAVLHHVPGEKNRLKFLQELYRVLKPGGRASIIVWNLLNDWSYKRFGIEHQLKNHNVDLGENDFLVDWRATPGKNMKRYIHCFTNIELKKLAKQAGFSKITIGYYTRSGKKVKNGEELVLNVWK